MSEQDILGKADNELAVDQLVELYGPSILPELTPEFLAGYMELTPLEPSGRPETYQTPTNYGGQDKSREGDIGHQANSDFSFLGIQRQSNIIIRVAGKKGNGYPPDLYKMEHYNARNPNW